MEEFSHAFSIEMKSKKFVKHISISNKSHCRVFVEGYLGELEDLCMVESSVLEIKGKNGILRIDISDDELGKLLLKDNKR